MQACAPRLARQRLLIVLSYRGYELRATTVAWPALRVLDRDFAPPRVLLQGLVPDECVEFARSVGSRIDCDAALDLYRRTGGHPLLLQTILAGQEHKQELTTMRAFSPTPAPLIVRLARADAPLGKPLADANRLAVRWTVDAGEADTALLRHAGKVALRRHRIKRLIAEACTQCAAPTDGDLARALGVTERTIESDMAAIRATGQAVPTRRRKAR
jgi:hypothetical protein